MGLGAPMKAGAAFGPIGFALGGIAYAVGMMIYLARKDRKKTYKPTISQQQKRGDLDSSEVEHYLHLGSYGAYEE